MLDRADRTERSLEIMGRAVAEHSFKFNQVVEEIRHLREDSVNMLATQNQMREEQGIMLRELISISKRVAAMEKP